MPLPDTTPEQTTDTPNPGSESSPDGQGDNERIRGLNRKISQLSSELNGYKGNAAKWQQEATDKEATIANLTAELTARENALKQREADLETFRKQVEQAQAEQKAAVRKAEVLKVLAQPEFSPLASLYADNLLNVPDTLEGDALTAHLATAVSKLGGFVETKATEKLKGSSPTAPKGAAAVAPDMTADQLLEWVSDPRNQMSADWQRRYDQYLTLISKS